MVSAWDTKPSYSAAPKPLSGSYDGEVAACPSLPCWVICSHSPGRIGLLALFQNSLSLAHLPDQTEINGLALEGWIEHASGVLGSLITPLQLKESLGVPGRGLQRLRKPGKKVIWHGFAS